jgi:hypothetical protein
MLRAEEDGLNWLLRAGGNSSSACLYLLLYACTRQRSGCGTQALVTGRYPYWTRRVRRKAFAILFLCLRRACSVYILWVLPLSRSLVSC